MAEIDIHAPGVEVKKSYCYFCHHSNEVLAYVKEGKVIKIEGDPNRLLDEDTAIPIEALRQQYWHLLCNSKCEEFDLTVREREVFSYLARGRDSRWISDHLALSKHTIKSHMSRIYQKVNVHSQQEIIDMVEA